MIQGVLSAVMKAVDRTGVQGPELRCVQRRGQGVSVFLIHHDPHFLPESTPSQSTDTHEASSSIRPRG